MHRLIPLLLALVLSAPAARADGEPAGEFDYYLLALSWSPTWCALEGRARNSPQCAPDRRFGWVLHGLWPQFEDGYPSYCRNAARPPSRQETAAMEDIMGTPGAAWYQWKKHGVCSGLAARDYFRLARLAWDRVTRPEVLRTLARDVTLPAKVVEQAFLEANPGWSADMLTITCKSGRIQEARLCLTRDLEPRPCGADVRRDCAMTDALLERID
ncbi:ribonuclease T [Pseudooceanicola sp. 216_PA32_1]|uniref:Ribonuclease T n=1 Tax=Pseudooceanicola pacificus TaxID=2676438 RepID=A0A844WER4_9RHOB|nr:ribonuclease T2 [Pseudooceanicola pacificus]MWB79292.1 ribonuclease T [Pseudooceanicola pacificus]